MNHVEENIAWRKKKSKKRENFLRIFSHLFPRSIKIMAFYITIRNFFMKKSFAIFSLGEYSNTIIQQ